MRLYRLSPTELRKLAHPAALVVVLLAAAGCQTHRYASAPPPPTKATQASMTPEDALRKLKEGNARFVAGQPLHRDWPAQRTATAAGQYPFAVILSCLDSRTSVEQVFDLGIGDAFNARVAGNILNDDILGSMEFACGVVGAKLIAVVGHSQCGAIKGACSQVELGHLTGLLKKIEPAVASVTPAVNRSAPAPAEVEAVAEVNVRLVMRQITERSPLLAGLVKEGKVAIVGGMQDLATGQVTFFN
ncbi:MAG: carbonic anhydrase [Verrucomicrobia bacterium]|nr:carbonic anhydrase [Verrucomicrobiota bacterium]